MERISRFFFLLDENRARLVKRKSPRLFMGLCYGALNTKKYIYIYVYNAGEVLISREKEEKVKRRYKV